MAMSKPSLPSLVEEDDFDQIDVDASLLGVTLLPESESKSETKSKSSRIFPSSPLRSPFLPNFIKSPYKSNSETDFKSGSESESSRLVPCSPLRSPFLPNFIKSPYKSPLMKNTKRRSVVAAQPYIKSRHESLKQKQREGKTSLNDLICSPTAQKNGCSNNTPEKKTIVTKMKRRSVMAAQPFSQSRLSSVKEKQKLGKKSLSALIESPSAQKNGHFFAEEEDEDEDET